MPRPRPPPPLAFPRWAGAGDPRESTLIALGALVLLATVAGGAAWVEVGLGDRAVQADERALRWLLGAVLGVGLWSTACAALRFAGLAERLASCWAGVVPGIGLAARFGWRLPRSVSKPWGADRAHPAMIALLLLAASIAAAAFIEHSLRNPDGGWDAVMVWNLRARLLARAADSRVAMAGQPGAHADYPLWLPTVIAGVWVLLGDESLAVPTVVAGLAALLTVAMLGLAIAREHGASWGILAATALLSTPNLVRVAANREADLPLAMTNLAALIALMRAQQASGRARISSLMLVGALAATSAWIKNEGAGLGVAIALGSLVVAEGGTPWRRRLAELALIAGGAAPIFAVWLWFKVGYAPPDDFMGGEAIANKVLRLADLGRDLSTTARLLRRLVYFQEWALMWIAALAGFVAILRGPRLAQPLRLVGGVLGLMLGEILIAFWLTRWDPAWQVRTAGDRLLFQLWPSAILVLMLGLLSALGSPQHQLQPNRSGDP